MAVMAVFAAKGSGRLHLSLPSLFGQLAQLVQSVRLTRERSLVRIQYCPPPPKGPSPRPRPRSRKESGLFLGSGRGCFFAMRPRSSMDRISVS